MLTIFGTAREVPGTRTGFTSPSVIIEQFQNLDLNKTRILGYYGQGSKFFDREILDGIYPKPGGAYHHSVGRHRRVLDISRQIFHVAPWVPLRQNMLVARSD